ncbi:acetyltransferase (GNAT) family protein [Natranaerovirga hydrolytica]|uniref:Acetyltransferase (GNAT) family protein n=1 Tax=Natranaerovirga hydrolytica TaxID=680378 RepID=A0A4R1MIZ1_9FIRM|nr:GNAT family N-acetyltransferase [Natranaerovirga hydrolytica]TCK92387.1 acetyltransferase (GNAT) family protein [Natranaerovirga hydrolytica]
MSVLNLKQEHISACANLYIEVFNNAPWYEHWIIEIAEKRLNDIYLTPNFEGLIYANNGHIEGALLGNYEFYYNKVYYNLKEIFISPRVQKQGIGSKLLKALEERAALMNVNEVILITLRDKKTMNFYFKNSYNEMENMVLMQKEK